MDRLLYCLKGPGGLCWWTVRPDPRATWEAGYPRSPVEPESEYTDRLKRIQNSLLIECVTVGLTEVCAHDWEGSKDPTGGLMGTCRKCGETKRNI